MPYPGLDPFGFEQRDLFFGRDAEGRLVGAMIASEPISVLTGASGLGKSSLIRASIVPTLISRGWCVVYAHPGADPVAELQRQLLVQAVPDPAFEATRLQAAMAMAVDASGHRLLHDESPASALREWYRSLPPDDPRRVEALGISGQKVPRLSLTAMWLAGVISAERAAEAAADLGGSDMAPDEASTMSLGRYGGLLAAAQPGRRRLVDALCAHDPDLPTLIERVLQEWLLPLSWRGLVFVLDQAEELYTAFGDTKIGPGVASGHGQPTRDVAIRDRLFQLLPTWQAQARSLPLRLCFSLRPEWYTELRVSMGAQTPDESRALHILSPMTRQQGWSALHKPAELLGGGYDDGAMTTLLDALEQEGGGTGIDPFILGQLGRLAWDMASEEAPDTRIEIRPEHLAKIAQGPALMTQRPDGHDARNPLVAGALLWLVQGVVQTIPTSDRFDALDMLCALFTGQGTRRIVTERELVERPLRSAARLRGLLALIDKARLVRCIDRDDATWVEIRHDRLARPVLAHRAVLIEQELEDPQLRRRQRSLMGNAIELLLRYDARRLLQALADGLRVDVLPGWARETLRWNRRLIEWDPPAARIMLASLLYEGPGRQLDDLHDHRQAMQEMLTVMSSVRAHRAGETPGELQAGLLRGWQGLPGNVAALSPQQVGSLSIDARLLLLDALLRTDPDDKPQANSEELRRWVRICLTLPPC